jgi:hypothetical protein
MMAGAAPRRSRTLPRTAFVELGARLFLAMLPAAGMGLLLGVPGRSMEAVVVTRVCAP